MTTKKPVLVGILIALSIVLTRLLSFYITDSVRVGFGEIPIILAGIWLGSAYGGVVGGLADVVGANLLSGLGFYPPLVVGPILIGAISGVMARVVNIKEFKVWKIAVIVGVTLTCASLVYTTFALTLFTGVEYMVLFIARLPVVAVSAVGAIIAISPVQARLGGQFLAYAGGKV